MAKLYFRYSAMNSGKTTSLIQAAFNYEERGMKPVIIKPSVDTKGGNTIVSRLGISREVDQPIAPDANIENVMEKFTNVDCILVDEAQFLTPKQVDQLFWYAVQKNVPVLAYGLRTDFQTKGFPGATRLLELAHEIQELKTICRCGRKAVLNGRKRDDRFIFEGDQVAIEGEASIEYESLCGSCYDRYRHAAV